MKVLVAEDDEHGCDVLTRRLQRVGYEVTSARSSAELKNTLSADEFDLVLLCFSPRENNGWKVASEVRAQTTVPIIAVSSVPFQSDHSAALQNGCKGYLPKPIDFKELLSTMKKIGPDLPSS